MIRHNLGHSTLPIGSFYATICQQIWQILDPSPLKNVNALKGWFLNSHLQYKVVKSNLYSRMRGPGKKFLKQKIILQITKFLASRQKAINGAKQMCSSNFPSIISILRIHPAIKVSEVYPGTIILVSSFLPEKWSDITYFVSRQNY